MKASKVGSDWAGSADQLLFILDRIRDQLNQCCFNVTWDNNNNRKKKKNYCWCYYYYYIHSKRRQRIRSDPHCDLRSLPVFGFYQAGATVCLRCVNQSHGQTEALTLRQEGHEKKEAKSRSSGRTGSPAFSSQSTGGQAQSSLLTHEQAGGCQENNTLSPSQPQVVRRDLDPAPELESGEVSEGNLPGNSVRVVAEREANGSADVRSVNDWLERF